MNIGKRKHAWPLAVGLSLAVVGMLAAFIAFAAQPGTAQAQGLCDGPLASLLPQCEGSMPPDPQPPTGDTGDDMMMMDAGPAEVDNSSTSASATVELILTIDSLPMGAVAGSSVELYLEDDFQVPDSIARDTVYFTVPGGTANQGGGGRVYATDPVEIDDDDHYGGDDDWSIRVFIPDMNTAENSGYNGPTMGQTLNLVITKAAGVKNPSEEGTHSVGYSVLGPNDDPNDGPQGELGTVATYAKISLSDEDNKRGYELTVTGSGFNNGTTAGAYVLHIDGDGSNAALWDALDCSEMDYAVGEEAAAAGDYCHMYAGLGAMEKEVVRGLDYGSGHAEAALCSAVIRSGANIGGAVVGSDDKVAVTAEVTVPTFQAGDQNYICMADGEGRASSTDVEQFELEPSIRVVPTTVAAGDIVNVFAQDYPTANAAFEGILLANDSVMSASSTSIGNDHSGSASFAVPGGKEGTLRVDATWGGVKKDSKITIAPSVLTLSKEEVSANESITIRGSGFGDGAGCLTSATISGADLMLISSDGVGNAAGCIDVEVSSAGQFAATVAVWSREDTNPALTPGTHTIEVTDDEGFTGSAVITIKEPTLVVTPEVAGPRDYITISGENWPVENEDGGNIDEVEIDIDSGSDDEDADPDASGRWSVTYRVAGDVTIPSTVPVKATYGSGSEIVKVGSFSVPQANLTVDPMRAVPGDIITLSATGMSLFESDIQVKIGSLAVSVPASAHTDRDGALENLEVLVPSLDPALYTVQLTVKDTVTIGELTVMDDTAVGVPQMLPDALMDVGDNLEAVFYFNDATKSWQVFDPRPEWADLNTLNELVSGQAYWILVKETQDDVVLNGRLRSLTCSGDNCWNLEVW